MISLPKDSSRGHSVLEMVSVVSILGIMAAVAYPQFKDVSENSAGHKTANDVASINRAIKVFQSTGGSLSGASHPQQVIDRLKTRLSEAETRRATGYSGQAIDPRLIVVELSDAEAMTDRKRAVWNAAEGRFEIATSGSGFRFDYAVSAEGAKTAEDSRSGTFQFNEGNGWIWKYDDSPPPVQLAPTVVALTPVNMAEPPSTPLDPLSYVPGAPQTQLLPPVFSHPGGIYNAAFYPAELTISNPNGSGSVYYLTSSSTAGWELYTAPLTLTPGEIVSAYVQSNLASVINSPITTGSYAVDGPKIATSPDTATIDPYYVSVFGNGDGSNNTANLTVSVTNSGPALVTTGEDVFNSGPVATAAAAAGFWATPAVTGKKSYFLKFVWDTTPEAANVPASTDAGSSVITLSFSRTLHHPVFHFDRLGGNGGVGTVPFDLFSNSAELSLLTGGISLTRLAGNGPFETSGTKVFRTPDVNLGPSGSAEVATDPTGTAGGSVQLNGSFSSVTFALHALGTEGLGADGFELLFEERLPMHDPISVDVTGNDTDSSGSTLTIIAVSAPAKGTAAASGNSVMYDPGSAYQHLAPGETATEVIQYTVQNSLGETATESLTIVIKG